MLGILADQMGLGKTVQTIAFLAYLKEVHKISGQHLVCSPLTVTYNWQKEFSKYFPESRTAILRATMDFRDEEVKEIRRTRPDVIIVSYDSLQKNMKFLSSINFEFFVVDEAHSIKNDESRLSEAVRNIRSKNRLLLTGTPLSNNTTELWSLLNFIMPGIFNSKIVFEEMFSEADNASDNKTKDDEALIKKLHDILAPFMLRRLKQDTKLDLPPKKEVYVYCPLSKMQRDLYKLLVTKNVSRSIRTGSMLMDLRKTAVHPYLFPEMDKETDDFGDHLIKNSGKFMVLDRLLERLTGKGRDKVLIFSQFQMVLNILEDYLVWRDYGHFRLDGNTTIEQRNEYMDEFNDPKQTERRIFIISTRAGGLGINLISASKVIILDSDWNPQMDMQAMDRCHRIGQTKPVTVYRLLSKSTVEERIIERQTIKLKLDYLIIERGRKFNKDLNLDFDLNQLNEQEVRDLAYFGANDILNLPDEDIENIDIDKLLDEGERIADEKNKFFEEKLKMFSEKAT